MLPFYLEVARTALRRQIIYRWANLAGLLTNVFFGSVLSFLYLALFQARHAAAGYQVNDALRYLWLVQSMTMVVLSFGWYDLMRTIQSGEVVTDLSKPCDFFWYWFSREVGRSVYYIVFRGLPTYLAGMLLFRIGAPTSWQTWSVYTLSLIVGTGIGISYRFLYNLLAFWIIEARAAGGLAAVFALFFTGSFVPVAFFPPGMRTIAEWLPFNGMMNTPAQIFLGKITTDAIPAELIRQVCWLGIFVLIARTLTVVATRRVVVQGG